MVLKGHVYILNISDQYSLLLLYQCCNQGTGDVLPWTQSQGGAGGPTARNGGARGTWWPDRSTANAMCTVAETVQESLWKSPHPSPPPLLQPVVVVVVGLSKLPISLLLRPWQPWLVGPILLFQDHPLPLISFTSVKGKNFLVFLWLSLL